MKKYALLIYEAPGFRDALSKEQSKAVSAEYVALANDPRYLGGAPLQPVDTATTVRVREGRTLRTDGPFADTKEVFGGYCVVNADDLEEAIELAARIPAARIGGAVEVRPVVER